MTQATDGLRDLVAEVLRSLPQPYTPQSAPAAMSWSAESEVVSPMQRAPATLAAATPETASPIIRQAEGSRSSRRAASTKISGAGFTHYTQC